MSQSHIIPLAFALGLEPELERALHVRVSNALVNPCTIDLSSTASTKHEFKSLIEHFVLSSARVESQRDVTSSVADTFDRLAFVAAVHRQARHDKRRTGHDRVVHAHEREWRAKLAKAGNSSTISGEYRLQIKRKDAKFSVIDSDSCILRPQRADNTLTVSRVLRIAARITILR